MFETSPQGRRDARSLPAVEWLLWLSLVARIMHLAYRRYTQIVARRLVRIKTADTQLNYDDVIRATLVPAIGAGIDKTGDFVSTRLMVEDIDSCIMQ